MEWLAAFIQRIKDDWRDLLALLRGEQPEDMPVAEMMMATMPPAPDQDIDWFVWECEQYAKSPVFWFDHWRYEGTEWAYTEPTAQQRQAVYLRSMERQIERLGRDTVVRRAEALNAALSAELDRGNIARALEVHFHPDPWAWAMSQAVH